MNMEIQNSHQDVIVPNIKSAAVCQLECQEEPKCKMFVWVTLLNECYLKEDEWNRTTLTESSHVFSGPKICGR